MSQFATPFHFGVERLDPTASKSKVAFARLDEINALVNAVRTVLYRNPEVPFSQALRAIVEPDELHSQVFYLTDAQMAERLQAVARG
jgi:hypothetical protein